MHNAESQLVERREQVATCNCAICCADTRDGPWHQRDQDRGCRLAEHSVIEALVRLLGCVTCGTSTELVRTWAGTRLSCSACTPLVRKMCNDRMVCVKLDGMHVARKLDTTCQRLLQAIIYPTGRVHTCAASTEHITVTGYGGFNVLSNLGPDQTSVEA
jgi:hypothetical protein